jgi:hypothetical protein
MNGLTACMDQQSDKQLHKELLENRRKERIKVKE